jgi:CRP-like cAMP-binding protein
MTNPSAASCPIFQGFTVDEYEQVLALLEQEAYAKGDVIIDEGKSQQDLWIVVKGSCEVVKMNKSKVERQLATLETGAVFGEMSFFQKAPHSATVRALTAVKVLRLTRERFEQLQTGSPSAANKIAVSVLAVMAQRIRRMDDWICNFVERPEAADHREEWHDFRAKLYADWQF